MASSQFYLVIPYLIVLGLGPHFCFLSILVRVPLHPIPSITLTLGDLTPEFSGRLKRDFTPLVGCCGLFLRLRDVPGKSHLVILVGQTTSLGTEFFSLQTSWSLSPRHVLTLGPFLGPVPSRVFPYYFVINKICCIPL